MQVYLGVRRVKTPAWCSLDVMDLGVALQGELPDAVNAIMRVCAQDVRASFGEGEGLADKLECS